MSYLIKQKLNEIMDMVEGSSYGKISSYALERLKDKCMGDDRHRVSFEYTIEWVGREKAFYVNTNYYGYWRLQGNNEWIRYPNNEWTRTDIDEEGDVA